MSINTSHCRVRIELLHMSQLLLSRASKVILTVFFAGTATLAAATDWLTLQGLEPAARAVPVKLWGFIQTQYQNDRGHPSATGNYIPPKLIGPNLDSQSAFNVIRARLGIRGIFTPVDTKINYFLLTEFGNNGITAPGDSLTKLTDASLTFNHLKGMHIRAGLFKYPGSEEGMRAAHISDYINFTSVTNQMMLERFSNRAFTPNIGPQPSPSDNEFNGYDKSAGAFRDVGVQLFNTYKLDGDWEFSYATMVGNGNGLNFSDNDNNKNIYIYLSTEKVFGGKGHRRQGLKFFTWSQQGKRTADLTNDGIYNPIKYDRDRKGVGFKYLRRPWRVTAEYMEGEGMIFQGPHNPSGGIGPGAGDPSQPGNGAYAQAHGWYFEGGYISPRLNGAWVYVTTSITDLMVTASKWSLRRQLPAYSITLIPVFELHSIMKLLRLTLDDLPLIRAPIST